ncbi:MAG: DUF5689 domain-containing protein [Flavobacteriaceae bacterium]|nr:DUF5689 domain-containing protein [Flavobacteriaceae bacterium]
MKTIKFLKLIMIAIVTITVASCVDSDEYDVPPIADQVEPNITVTSSIQNMKSALNQHFNDEGESKMTFDRDSDVVFAGYVVSSDYAGNFFRSIVIQDAPENPTHGIEVLINKTSLFENYEIGRKVYVKMAGLSISYEDGEDNDPTDTNALGRYAIGMDEGGFSLDEIPLFTYLETILRSTEVATIVPTPVVTSGLTEDHINTFIQLNDMQFSVEEVGKTFSGETNDQFDGFRNLVNCTDDSTAILQTSTFADFSSYEISNQVGTINAVLAKDFRADFLVLVINDPTNIDFTGTERCDPLFNEDFQDGISAWTTYSVLGGQVWGLDTFGGGSRARMSGWAGGPQNNEDWLISPAIDLSGVTSALFSFDNLIRFNGPAIEVLMSTDYTGGDPTTDGTWTTLTAILDTNSGSWSSWTNSGDIDVSAAAGGNLFVAFKYVSSSGAGAATIQIDDIKVE